MDCQPNSSIIVAEDDPDDRLLIKNAFQEADRILDLDFVNNGEELLRYLDHAYRSDQTILPRLIILDLNMPKMGGHQVLTEVKKKAEFHSINFVVLSTSSEKSDIEFCRNHGVNLFFTKPDSYEGFVEIIKTILIQSTCNKGL